MGLRPRDQENRIREIRNKLHDADRCPTPTGALMLLKEAADQLTILINLQTTQKGNGHETEADPGRQTPVKTPG